MEDGIAAGLVLVSGRLVPPSGGFLIVKGSRAAVEALVAAEPFSVRGLAGITIQEITIPMTAPGLEALTDDGAV